MKKKEIIAVFLSVLLIIIIYLYVNIRISEEWLTVNEYDAETENGGEVIRAVVISDLHDHQFGEKNEKLISMIEQLNPDIVFMAGDMLNGSSDDGEVPLELVKTLSENVTVIYSFGNHELSYMENGHSELAEELEQAGAQVLEKTYVDLEIKGREIRVGGLYEYAFGLDGNNTALAASAEIRDFLTEFQDTECLKIMLSHRPDSFIFGDAAKTWKIDLVISGHNHGGQVVIPFLGGLYGGDQGWFPEYVHGLYRKDNIKIFITSGLGSDKQTLPRFNNRPEIALLLL